MPFFRGSSCGWGAAVTFHYGCQGYPALLAEGVERLVDGYFSFRARRSGLSPVWLVRPVFARGGRPNREPKDLRRPGASARARPGDRACMRPGPHPMGATRVPGFAGKYLIPGEKPWLASFACLGPRLWPKGRFATGGGAQANKHLVPGVGFSWAGCWTEVEQPACPGTSSRRRGWKMVDGWEWGEAHPHPHPAKPVSRSLKASRAAL